MISLSSILEMSLIGSSPSYPLDGDYILANDIDASGTATWNGGLGFKPIGSNVDPFTGSLNGNGYTISGLYINRPTEDYIGLFGGVSYTVSLSDVKLVGGDIVGKGFVGFLVGIIVRPSGVLYSISITNCSSTGSVSSLGVEGTGGLVGYIGSYPYQGGSSPVYGSSITFTGCSSSSRVEGYEGTGGLIGSVYTTDENFTVSFCYASGNVVAKSTPVPNSVVHASRAGGLIGVVDCSSWDVEETKSVNITNSYATGDVFGGGGSFGDYRDSSDFAGFIGWLYIGGYNLLIDRCWSSSNVSAHGSYNITGFIGGFDLDESTERHTISNCYSTGDVTLTGVRIYGCGSFLGDLYLRSISGLCIENCYCTGNLTITENGTASWHGVAYVAGFIASAYFDYDTSIENSYYTGEININSPINILAGGFIGATWGDFDPLTTTIDKCFCRGSMICISPKIYDVAGFLGSCYDSGYLNISNCFSEMDIYCPLDIRSSDIAGFIGSSWVGYDLGSPEHSLISNCYSVGTIVGGDSVGGFLGYEGSYNVRYENCYSYCDVFGEEDVGGFCGFIEGKTGVSLVNCYSSSTVQGSLSAGGFIGINEYQGMPVISQCFWDTEVSGQLTSDGGTGKTTSEMQIVSTFTGWDFDTIWGISTYDEYKYPKFFCAEFVSSTQSGLMPLRVDFTNTSVVFISTVQSILWDFGDGNTSTGYHANNTYLTIGSYIVTLTLTNQHGEKTVYKSAPLVVSKTNNLITFNIAVSPKDYGTHLCVGTDQGRTQVSENGGALVSFSR